MAAASAGEDVDSPQAAASTQHHIPKTMGTFAPDFVIIAQPFRVDLAKGNLPYKLGSCVGSSNESRPKDKVDPPSPCGLRRTGVSFERYGAQGLRDSKIRLRA